MKPFRTVYFDIVGFCNARCPYCPTGRNKQKIGESIAPDTFKQILIKLQNAGAIDSKSVISLYNWGEPLIHPGLHEIIGVVNSLNIKYAISTNAAKIPAVNKDFIKNLNHVIFSMSGFSQSSYDRIHGFDLEKIKNNIVKFVNECRQHGFRGDFSISYHVYKFNTDEIKSCEDFASKHGIIFNPYYAVLNQWWEMSTFVNGEMPQEQVKEISEDIFGLDEIAETMKKTPADYRCQQFDYMIITENGDVPVCCQTPKSDPDFTCGNILSDEVGKIVERKENMRVCGNCIQSGLAFYINSSLRVPEFYRRSAWQYYLLFRSKFLRKLKLV